MTSCGESKSDIDKYLKRLRSPKVIELISQFETDSTTKNDIATSMVNILRYLDSDDVNNQKLINTLCNSLIKFNSYPQEVKKALDLIRKGVELFQNSELLKEKVTMHIVDIIEYNLQTNQPKGQPQLIGIEIENLENHGSQKLYHFIELNASELISPKLHAFIEKESDKMTNDELMDKMLRSLAIKDPNLLTEKEKERLLSPQQTRIPPNELRRLSIGEYVLKNVSNINEFLERRKKLDQNARAIKILGEIDLKEKTEASKLTREDAISMFVLGINGSRDPEKQTKYRKMLQEQFKGIDSGKAFEAWKKVKQELLKPLVAAYQKIDYSDQSSIKAVMDIFLRGIEKLPKEEAKELRHIFDQINIILNNELEESKGKILAFTVGSNDHVINLEAARISACTLIDNPIGSHAIFDYALDPSIILINYALIKPQSPIPHSIENLTISGIAMCALGKVNSQDNNGTILIVDSVEGGINFSNAVKGKEKEIVNTIVKKAQELGVDYLGFYTNLFDGTYGKSFAEQIKSETQNVNIKLSTTRSQYLDIVRREKQNKAHEINAPVKLIDLRRR